MDYRNEELCQKARKLRKTELELSIDKIEIEIERSMSYDCALRLHEMGLKLTPVKRGGKEPILPDWPNHDLQFENLAVAFDNEPNNNIGVKLGRNAGGIVEIDLDSGEAAVAAEVLAPVTRLEFGRHTKPRSHKGYKVPDAQATIRLKDPETSETIVELRSNGSQTVFPDSIHPSGEVIRFEDGKDGPPSASTYEELSTAVHRIAICHLLSRKWRPGTRHDLALAFAGFCASSMVKDIDCLHMIKAVCRIVNDDDVSDRERCVEDSYRNAHEGRYVKGASALLDLVGTKVFQKIRLWLIGQKIQEIDLLKQVSIPKSTIVNPTDLSYGKSFAAAVHSRMKYSDTEDKFYVSDHGVFSAISTVRAMGYVYEYLDWMEDAAETPEDRKRILKAQSNSTMKSILSVAKSYLKTDSSQFDSDPNLVGCKNGVLDLKTSKLVDPNTIVTRRLGTSFDADAQCPIFEKFIHQIMGGRTDLVQFIRRVYGYALSGHTDQQCMFVGIGSGANGKTSVQRNLQKISGEYGASIPMQSLTISRYGASTTYDLADLIGKRAVFAQEAESNQQFAAAKIKAMTGEDMINCRQIYSASITYRPAFKIFAFTNSLPSVASADDAFWRRMRIIPFDITILPENRDPHLGTKLDNELPGILNWALEGFADYLKLGGLHPPESVLYTTSTYREDGDTVKQFVDARCDTTGDDTFTMTAVLYSAYTIWCHNSAVEPLSNITFGKNLTRLGFKSKSTKAANGRLGIRLTE